MGVDLQRVNVLDDIQTTGVRGIRMSGVKGVDVRQQHEGLSAHQLSHQGSESVVVAELDLPGGNGVVLVDDWHDSQLEQGVQGRPGISIGGGADQVIDGQQYLSDPQPVAGKT